MTFDDRPACRHSACRERWKDTGDPSCLRGTEDYYEVRRAMERKVRRAPYAPGHLAGGGRFPPWRSYSGSKVKLKVSEARAILRARPPKVGGRYENGKAVIAELREKYRVSETTIRDIWTGASWGFLHERDSGD